MNDAASPRRLTEEEQLRLGTDIQKRLGVKTVRNESLARFSTMRVGGRADERLESPARPNRRCQSLDRLGLIAGRRELGDHLERA